MLSSTNRPDRGSEYLPRPTGGATRFEFEWNCQLEFLSWTITWRREPPFAHFSNGIQTAYEIRRIAPSTKMVFFTVHDSPQLVSAMRVFSNDFVSKSEAGTELIPTLNRLAGIAVGK